MFCLLSTVLMFVLLFKWLIWLICNVPVKINEYMKRDGMFHFGPCHAPNEMEGFIGYIYPIIPYLPISVNMIIHDQLDMLSLSMCRHISTCNLTKHLTDFMICICKSFYKSVRDVFHFLQNQGEELKKKKNT